MMMIKDQYKNLINKKTTLDLLEPAKSLRDQCVLEQNLEYYYLTNLFIIDIHIEYNQLDQAIKIINNDLSRIDNTIFRNIYVSYLERLIYIYIKKRNFAVAYRYVFEKRQYINEKNRDDVNRWYLEMAYIYAEMNQKAKAVDSLNAIIENLPSDELLSLALNNLTKLYIDQKMIPEAKEALNQSLIVTQDEEGKLYCHYLFAKICILENKFNEALVLFEDIFKNEINENLLSIANDYLEILIKLNLYSQGEDFISRISKYIEKSDDLFVQKEFYKNKLKLVFHKHNLHDYSEIISKIDELENTILIKNALDLEETYEDEKHNEILNQLQAVISRLEHVINLISIAFSSDNIRDILIEYSKKLQSIINLEEITFVFYDHFIKFIGPKDDITTYEYKKERLYERSIAYDNLKNTAVEAIINHGNEIIVDLNETNLGLIDLNTQKKYRDLGINYLYAIPNYREEKLFGTVIYKSQYTDFAALENNIILKVATKLLENEILNSYLKLNEHLYDFIYNHIITYNNVYTIIHHDNKLILSDNLKKVLGYQDNIITFDDYLARIIKSDLEKYQQLDFSKPNKYNLKYRIKINNQYLQVNEQIDSLSIDNKLLFLSTLTISEEEVQIAADDNEFAKKILQLKAQAANPEFKFSLIRIKGDDQDYHHLMKIFGLPPYRLGDGTFVIILENEVNQRTLDKYTKTLKKDFAIVRYPRDVVNIDEVVKFSKINLDEKITYFTDEAYQQYAKKVSINNLVAKTIIKPLELWYRQINSPQKTYEVICRVNGVNEKDNVRIFLEHQLLNQYDQLIYNSFENNNKEYHYLINLTVAAANQLLQENKIKYSKNIIICLDHYETYLCELVEGIKALGLKVFLDQEMLDLISIYDLIKLNIDGVVINVSLEKNRRQQVLGLAEKFNLPLLTNYQYNDYQNCIYRTNMVVREL